MVKSTKNQYILLTMLYPLADREEKLLEADCLEGGGGGTQDTHRNFQLMVDRMQNREKEGEEAACVGHQR